MMNNTDDLLITFEQQGNHKPMEPQTEDEYTEEIKPVEFISTTQWCAMFDSMREGQLPFIEGYFVKSFIRKKGKYAAAPYFIISNNGRFMFLKGLAKLKPLINNVTPGTKIKVECLGMSRNAMTSIKPLDFSVRASKLSRMGKDEIDSCLQSLASVLDDLEEKPEEHQPQQNPQQKQNFPMNQRGIDDTQRNYPF